MTTGSGDELLDRGLLDYIDDMAQVFTGVLGCYQAVPHHYATHVREHRSDNDNSGAASIRDR